MTQALPARLNEALSQLLQIEWRFEDDADGSTDQAGDPDYEGTVKYEGPDLVAQVWATESEEIEGEGDKEEKEVEEEEEYTGIVEIQDVDWKQYLLGLIEMRYGRELSDAEEAYEKSMWLRAQLMRRHLDEFRRLTDAALRFFQELTEAGGQCILGERARLPVLKRSEQPHSQIQFEHVSPPNPPPLSIDEYEQMVGALTCSGPGCFGGVLRFGPQGISAIRCRSQRPFGANPFG